MRTLRIRRARLALLVGAALGAFIVGRVTAPEGISEDRLDELRAAAEAAEREVEAMKLALENRQATPTPTASPSPEPEPSFDSAGRRIYVVQEGDTMREIAETFCGDVGLAGYIAAFNDIDDSRVISIGTELKIPKDCTS